MHTMSPDPAVRPGLLTAKLGLIELVAWGALFYTFPVFMPAMEVELGVSSTILTMGFSLALLISGITAPQVGAWIDGAGSRGLMVCASLAGSFGMVLWSMSHGLSAYFAAWVLIGFGMAGTLYAPAFATVVRAIPGRSRHAILVITLVAALASTVFLPLAAVLTEHWGWRGAARWMALILAGVSIPLAATLPRRPYRAAAPSTVGSVKPRGDVPGGFRAFALALMLADGASQAINVYLVIFLVEHGHALPVAAGIAGLAGAAKVGGRLATAVSSRISALCFMIATLFFQGASLLLPTLWPTHWASVVMVLGFGAAAGARTVLRPMVLVEMCGTRDFGRNNGRVQLLTTLANASGPVGFAWVVDILGWSMAWSLLAVIVGISGILLLWGVPRANRTGSPNGAGLPNRPLEQRLRTRKSTRHSPCPPNPSLVILPFPPSRSGSC